MAKKTNHKRKEKEACTQLSELQTENLAHLIISEAGCTDISRGTGRRKKKKTAAGRNSNDFLMGRILPIAPDYYMENAGEEKINLTTRESFDYLYRSALNYTGIIGSGLPFRKKKASPRINIINLYKALENILPEHVNLEVRNGRLHFCLYRFHKWPEPRLFWIPLDFTEKLPGQLRGIALEFIRRLMRHHSIQSIKETFQYEMARTYLEDYGHYDGEATAREIRSRARLAKMYEKGKFHRLLERMGKKKNSARIWRGRYKNTIRKKTTRRHY